MALCVTWTATLEMKSDPPPPPSPFSLRLVLGDHGGSSRLPSRPVLFVRGRPWSSDPSPCIPPDSRRSVNGDAWGRLSVTTRFATWLIRYLPLREP